jgi:hypothetical protein
MGGLDEPGHDGLGDQVRPTKRNSTMSAPRGSMTGAVSACPHACCCPVGANSETGNGGDRDKTLSIAKKRERQSLSPAAP